MTAQTVYSKNQSNALPGLIYDMGNTDIDSYAAEGAVAFGVFVARGTDPANQVEVTGAAGSFGVATRTVKEGDYPDAAFDGGAYADEETVGVMRSGYVWAQFDAAGGTIGAAVTINADGTVDVAGGATAVTGVSATIERPAVDLTVGGDGVTGVFVGLVKLGA